MDLLRARLEDVRHVTWQPIAHYRPSLRRRLSEANRFTARIFRDGFHALAILPYGAIVGAVPGSIITLRPGETEFRQTHAITRGTCPLHITETPSGVVYWGEYFDNAARDAVHIYGSVGAGETWSVAYTFPKGSIRHVHNIVHDPWGNCLWILTGDYGDNCRILRASCDFSRVQVVLQGNQQARAVAAVPTEDALYFSSDTPLEPNSIYRLDHQGALTQLAAISSSPIYGCRVRGHVFFSTMIEPSEVNRDRTVRVYGADVEPPIHGNRCWVAERRPADGPLPVRQRIPAGWPERDTASRGYHDRSQIRRHGDFAVHASWLDFPLVYLRVLCG
jgi:hypothetical protein